MRLNSLIRKIHKFAGKESLSGEESLRIIERFFNLSEILAERSKIKILENNELLKEIPRDIFSFEEPHPYQMSGSPYGTTSPFFLRSGVVDRLLKAQQKLDSERPGFKLHIFDGFRPISVQEYMVDYTFRKYASEAGLNPDSISELDSDRIMKKVLSVWAMPNRDPISPPPHSTGAVVDLSILGVDGKQLMMGSDFDEPSDRILPHFYSNAKDDHGKVCHSNRELLLNVMKFAGFARLTHEWWHFCYGDQMWALLEGIKNQTLETPLSACYAAVD
ncbi:MAG: M15 family metallopeptidase [bacterium]|nr:M15 family metallopeptidase [bacterium]